jgi:cobalt-zinc-cadmium resistance protein CzcA
MRFNELMTGARQDVVCKIFGENLDTLSKYANLLSTISNKVEGIKNIYVEPILGNPQLVIKYNRSALAQFNLNINDVNKIVNTSLAGQTAGIVFEGEKRFDLVVKIKNELKKNIQDINSILIPMPNGSQVPLQQIAAVTEEESPNQIQREDAKRRIVVGFNVRNVDVETVVHELQKKLNTNLKLPTGYYITYGGSFENLNAAKQRLFIAVPVSLLLIFVLLYFAFNSIKQGLLIYTAIPLSAIGGILFLALRGLPFSISAGIGFIALFGVAVLNGIVLIAEFNRLKQDGLTDIKRIILMGTKVRLRPILMTAFVASLGFFPMAISNGAGAEVQRPLATVVIGGLLIATFLTLFVLPILYMIVEGGFKKIKVQQKVAIIVVICFGSTFQITANAQPPISLKVAIDIALRNNLTIKNEQLKVQYQQALIGSATNINATNFSAEYGKMNSAYNDTKFLIAQGFALPKLYQQQKQFLTAEWNNSLLSVKVNELVLKKQVTEIYCHWQYLLQKQILLIKLDSLYQSFYNAVKIKLQKGETNVLEKAFAETNLLNITNQKNSIEADLKIVELQFQMLLNTTANYTLKIDDEPLSIAKLLDTAALHQHPTMQQISQKEQIAKAMIAVDKAKLLPEFSLGYNNSSIKGFGADDQYYASSERFGSVQLSMAIPVFANAQKAKIKSSEINLKVTEATTQIELKNFHSSYKIAVINYNKQLKIVEQLKSIGLLNINIINTSANLQFANGNINFLEWGQLMHQAINIENDYIEAVKSLNEAATQVNYFNN